MICRIDCLDFLQTTPNNPIKPTYISMSAMYTLLRHSVIQFIQQSSLYSQLRETDEGSRKDIALVNEYM